MLELGERYPGDAGVLASLLLNRISLKPGEAHLSARGQPAHLSARRRRRGDGQLRQRAARRADPQTRRRARIAAGARLHAGQPSDVIRPRITRDGIELVYNTPAPEFAVSVLCIDGEHLGHEIDAPSRHDGPQILLCTEGSAVVHAKSSCGDAGAWSGRVGGRRRRADPAGRADVRPSCSAPPWASREGPSLSTEGSTRAILAALLANAGIAVAKFVGFLITGSSSMLAESVHSVADTSQPGPAAVRPAPGPQRSRPAAPVRVRPQPLLLLVRRGAGVVHPRLGVRALRGLPQDLPPRGAHLTDRGDRDPGGGNRLGVATAFAPRSWSRDR